MASVKKVILFLMNYRGLAVLNGIIDAGYREMIAGVITSADIGMQHDYSVDIAELCNLNSIFVLEENEIGKFSDCIAILVGWRRIVKWGGQSIVLHDSLLPSYSGFAPLVSAIKNKETSTGVTAFWAVDDYDRGDIISQLKLQISYPIKIQSLIEQISPLYVKIACSILDKLKRNIQISASPQDESKRTFSVWLDEEDYHINWDVSAEEILRKIDASGYPYLGAFSLCDNKKYRILSAVEIEDVCIENRTPGKVFAIRDNMPVVICKSGLLHCQEIIDDQSRTNVYSWRSLRVRFK
mgnify:CR=1 FL=1